MDKYKAHILFFVIHIQNYRFQAQAKKLRKTFFLVHFKVYFHHRLLQTYHSLTVINSNAVNSHKIEIIIPALQSCHGNLFDQAPNAFVISYHNENINDNAIKLAVYLVCILHKRNFTGLQYLFR